VKRSEWTKWGLWQIDLAAAAGCAVLAAVAYLAGIRPLLEKRVAVAESRQQLNARRKEYSASQATVAGLRRQLEQVRADLSKIRVRLQSLRSQNARVARMTELANECGLKLDNVGIGEPLSTPRYVAVPITLVGRGAYADCVRFLKRLNRLSRDVGVVGLELSDDPSNATGTCAFEFRLLWHAAPTGSPRAQPGRKKSGV